MAVHYKFNAAKEYDTLPVDGLHISLADLKDSIIHHKRLGRGDLCDLQVTNAETKEVYTNDKALIPKNSSLIIARVPLDPSQRKFGSLSRDDKELLLSNPEYRMNTEGAEEAEQLSRKLEEVPDLTKFAGTEEEKISAMIAQSTIDFHPSRYLKMRNTVMSGKVPPFYKCYKCHQGGHWVSNCPLNNQDLRKSTGIPSKFLVEVDDPNAPGVMITATGKYVVFRQSLVMGENTKAKVRQNCSESPPDELVCLLCKDLMQDAVLSSCCVNAYCDDCLRNALLESEDHLCPTCGQKGVSPDTLVPNRYLRLKILQFGNQFLTELPKESLNSGGSSPIKVLSNSRPETPQEIILNAKYNSPKVVVSAINSPEVYGNNHQEPEDDKDVEKIDRQILEGMKYEEDRNRDLLLIKEDEEEDDFSSRVKVKKHGKKSKKKKEGDKEKKHKKKDKEKDKKKKNKKKGKDKAELNTSLEEGLSNTLMNEAICPQFNPTVPPPRSIHIPPAVPMQGYLGVRGPYPYVQTMPMAGGAIPHHPQRYPHIPEDDPLTTFEMYLKKKDEQKKKRLRSQSSSRSPPFRGHSHSRAHPLRSYSRSRSRSRSPSWDRKGGPSPMAPRRRYSPSPTNSRHGYRSVSRDRSPSYSRSPSSRLRLKKSSPLSSSHAYTSNYSPHRHPKDIREKRPYENPYSQNYQYNAYPNNTFEMQTNLNYVPRYPDREPHKDAIRGQHRHPYEGGNYNTFIDSAGLDPSKDPRRIDLSKDHRRIDVRRRLDEKRVYEDRHRSSAEDYKRLRDEHDYKRRGVVREKRSRSKEHKPRFESRRRNPSSPEDYRGKKDYESPRDYNLDTRSKWYKRDTRLDRRENGESSKKSRSISPREDRKGTREKVRKVSKEKDEFIKESEKEKEKKKHSKKEQLKIKEKEEKLSTEPVEVNEHVYQEEEHTENVEKEKGKEEEKEKEKEKKKHEKKKKKKEKRRASQASIDGSGISEVGMEEEEKKKRKREKKKLKVEHIESKHEMNAPPPSTSESELSQPIISSLSSQETLLKGEDSISQPESSSEKQILPPQDMAFLPVLSKWERDDDDVSSPSKVFAEQDKKEENLVTSDVIKRAENALFSKGLSNRSLISRKVYLEKNKEKEIEPSRTPTPEWERVDTREAKKKGSSIQITISSKTESQIGRPKVGKLEEVEKKVEVGPFEERSNIEKSKEEYKPDSHVVKKRDHSLSKEEKIIKKPRLDIEKDAHTEPANTGLQSFHSSKDSQTSLEDKHNSKDVVGKPNESPCHNALNQQEMEDEEKSIVNINTQFSDEHISSSTEVEKDQGGESELPNISQADFSSRQIDIQSHPVTSCNEPAESKNHDSEPEEGELVEDSNIEAVPDSTYQKQDKKIEPDSSFREDLSHHKLDELSSITGIPQDNEIVIERNLEELGPGHQGAYLLSPPSPIFKRLTKDDKQKDKKVKKKRRKKSVSPSSSSSSSSDSSSSDEENEITKKKKKKKKKLHKRKREGEEHNSDEEGDQKSKKKKKDKKKKKKKDKKHKEGVE